MGIIQRQSIQSMLFILSGFALGAINTVILYPRIFEKEEYGLIQVIITAGLTGAMLGSLGSSAIVYKFSPYYQSHLDRRKNDLPFLSGILVLTGFVLLCLFGYFGKDLVVRKFSQNASAFVKYYPLVFPYMGCLMLFTWLETIGWSYKRGVLTNAMKEGGARLITTVLLVIAAAGLINFDQFTYYFSFLYLLPAVFIFIVLRKNGELYMTPPPSKVTRRFRGKIFTFALYIFGAQFLNLLAKVADTFFVASKTENGLGNAAILTIATYLITLMELPQRSMNSISIPVMSESWKDGNRANIRNIYYKSVSNLLVIGLVMFGLLWLNAENLSRFLGKGYTGIAGLVFFLGIAKLIDLGTGVNSQIIATSNYWRFDFFTNIIYTLLSLPLNYFLISRYQLMGAAYANVIALTTYNLIRYLFLYFKFGFQPYNFRHLLALGAGLLATLAAWLIPEQSSWILDALLRSAVFLILFLPLVIGSGVAPELNKLALQYLPVRKKQPGQEEDV